MMMYHPRDELVHTSCLAIHKLSQLTNYLHIHPTKLQNMNQAWLGFWFFSAFFCVSIILAGNFPEHYDLVNLVVWQFNSSTIIWCAAAYLGPTMLLMDRAAAPLRYKATCCFEWFDGGDEGCSWDGDGDGDGDSSKYWNQLDFSNAGFLAVSCLPVS